MSSAENLKGNRARPLARVALLSTTALVTMLAAAGRADVPPPRDAVRPATASNGVPGKDQSERGKAAYAESCSPCHRSDLSGDQNAPALVGAAFMTRWMDQSVGDLFDNIRTGMPMDNPGGLSDNAFVDIVAYILQQNNYAAGGEELEADREALKKTRIASK